MLFEKNLKTKRVKKFLFFTFISLHMKKNVESVNFTKKKKRELFTEVSQKINNSTHRGEYMEQPAVN